MVSIAGTAADTAPLGRRRAEGTAAQERPFGPRFMTPMLMGATLNPVNSSVIATALVSIAVALRIPMGQTSILISSLYLTSAVAQPTARPARKNSGRGACSWPVPPPCWRPGSSADSPGT